MFGGHTSVMTLRPRSANTRTAGVGTGLFRQITARLTVFVQSCGESNVGELAGRETGVVRSVGAVDEALAPFQEEDVSHHDTATSADKQVTGELGTSGSAVRVRRLRFRPDQ